MRGQFEDRKAAGRILAKALERYRDRDDVLVLALPRGGVPVAYEVARELGAELDVLVVRKLGVPGYPELAMGAIASGGVRILNDDVTQSLALRPSQIDAVAEKELEELARREHAYRGSRPMPAIRGRTVILVDDGLATGASMKAAVAAVRKLGATEVAVAVPVAPVETVLEFRGLADDVVAAATPQPFHAVGQWYRNFDQTSDEEVHDLLERAHGAAIH